MKFRKTTIAQSIRQQRQHMLHSPFGVDKEGWQYEIQNEINKKESRLQKIRTIARHLKQKKV